MTFDLILAGSGGQGVVTLSQVLLRAALDEGYDAHMTGRSGISQLEGPVLSFVRIGTPAGRSAKIGVGRADAMLALDRLEALRNAHYVKPGGLVLVDTEGVVPVGARHAGVGYPSMEETEIAFSAQRFRWVPGTEHARSHGSPQLAGAVLLGALSAHSNVLDRTYLVSALRKLLPDQADMEAEAFFGGITLETGAEL